jgi:hypothetical protein
MWYKYLFKMFRERCGFFTITFAQLLFDSLIGGIDLDFFVAFQTVWSSLEIDTI